MVCLLFIPECPTMVLLKYTIFYTLSVVWKSLLFLSDMSSVYLFSHTFAISAQMPPESSILELPTLHFLLRL